MKECGNGECDTASGSYCIPRPCRFAYPHSRIPSFPQ